MIQTIVKRDGRIVGFNDQKIMAAIRKAMLHTEKGEDERLIQQITDHISVHGKPQMSVEDIQDAVEMELMKSARKDVAQKYIAYRNQRSIARKAKTREVFLGNELEPLDERYKTQSNLIDGCQSRVWLQCDEKEGKLYFTADSDALIVKGIIALLIRVVSGHTPQEIMDAELYFIDRIGLHEHLSPTRANGLLAMVKQMKMYALAFQAKQP